jgi:excisionase family DNA binding protein
MPEAAPSPWLTVKQAAERARVGSGLIYREVKAGRLRAARIGGRRDLRFLDSWVDEWLVRSATPVEVRRVG